MNRTYMFFKLKGCRQGSSPREFEKIIVISEQLSLGLVYQTVRLGDDAVDGIYPSPLNLLQVKSCI